MAPLLRIAPAVAGLVLAVAGACAPDPSAPRPAGAISLTSGFAPDPDPDVVRAAFTPPTDDASLDQARRIVDLVQQQGVRVFTADPPPEFLNEIELSHFATGEVLALADLVREAVDLQGEASPLRPRLAWLYQRIGLPAEARDHAGRALAARPDDPLAHFVQGFILGQDPHASDQVLAQVGTHFERTLALSPAFLGPGGVDARTLRRELDALRQR